jgi:hypothetical protein
MHTCSIVAILLLFLPKKIFFLLSNTFPTRGIIISRFKKKSAMHSYYITKDAFERCNM